MAHIQIRISYDDKQDAQAVLESLGLNFSSAIKLFLRQVVREQKLPFEISAVPAPTPKFQNQVAPAQSGGFSSRKIG